MERANRRASDAEAAARSSEGAAREMGRADSRAEKERRAAEAEVGGLGPGRWNKSAVAGDYTDQNETVDGVRGWLHLLEPCMTRRLLFAQKRFIAGATRCLLLPM